MDKDKMCERILNHALEIIYLLTGEASLLQHLTSPQIMIEKSKNKKMCERILNHTLEIIYLLTGEEYTIVLKNSPHSNIHQLSGECDIDGHKRCLEIPSNKSSGTSSGHLSFGRKLDEEEEPKLTGHLQVKEEEIPINISKGLQDENVYTESVKEEEDEREEDETQQVESHSYLSAGGHLSFDRNIDQEEKPKLTGHLQVKDEEVPTNISKGLQDENVYTESVKVEEDEREEQETQQVESHSYLSADATMNINIPGQHPGLQKEKHFVTDVMGETKIYSEAINANNTQNEYRSKPAKNKAQELNSHMLTHKNNTTREGLINKSTVGVNNQTVSLPSFEQGEPSLSYSLPLITHQSGPTADKPFTCSECGKCFTSGLHLVRHQKYHRREKTFKCFECGKSFISSSHLNRHQKSHMGEKPFPCSECGKCFSQKCHLVRHQLNHKQVKPFACSECGKSFTRKSLLIYHERIHTGEKPFACSDCGRCFREKSGLIKHETIHTGERPFACMECGKCFRQKPDLILHERIHTGEKPFTCSDCGKQFKQKSHHAVHKRTHTRGKLVAASKAEPVV